MKKPTATTATKQERVSPQDAKRIGDARLAILAQQRELEVLEARATILAAELLRKYRLGPTDSVGLDGVIKRG